MANKSGLPTRVIDSKIEAWILELVHRDGHQHLYQKADEIVAQLKSQELSQEKARELFGKVVTALASEIETTVGTAAHPGATMNAYGYFRSLEVTGQPYRVSQGWARYLDRLIDLLQQFHHTLFEIRGATPVAFNSTVAGRLASPLYHVRGSTLRGPQFSVEFAVDLARLARVLEEVGFFVPQRDFGGFSNSEGPAEDSMFCIDDDACFRALLTGAAKSKDSQAVSILAFFSNDEEPWVAELAQELLLTYFGRGL
jgi:hypothetical protein